MTVLHVTPIIDYYGAEHVNLLQFQLQKRHKNPNEA
jgi:hypothetical protein